MSRVQSSLKRCTECREWYRAKLCAVMAQRVCGQAACKLERKRKLARGRRSARLQDYRVDERERQRECRERKRAAGCHAPPSDGKAALVAAGMLETLDEVLCEVAALSRATLQRRIPRLARLWASESRTGEDP